MTDSCSFTYDNRQACEGSIRNVTRQKESKDSMKGLTRKTAKQNRLKS